MSEYSFSQSRPENTGERVAMRADKTNLLLRRWGGCWIDFIAIAVLFFVIAVVVGVPARVLHLPEWLGGLFAVVLVLGYYPVTEGVWGRTLGKLITGTIVVRRDGSPASMGQVIVRTLLRVIEVNPFLIGGVPAGICVLATKGSQRIGDLAAGTYVVPVGDLRLARSTTADVFS